MTIEYITVTFPTVECHCLLTSVRLCCLLTEARVCEQLAQGCYLAVVWPGVESTTVEWQVVRPNHYTTQATQDLLQLSPKESRSFFVWA